MEKFDFQPIGALDHGQKTWDYVRGSRHVAEPFMGPIAEKISRKQRLSQLILDWKP